MGAPTLARMVLAPILLWQGRRVRSRVPRLPEPPGPREGLSGRGTVRLRLLVLGDSSAAGVGVRDQRLALAGPLADSVSARVQGAVAWTLRAHGGLTLSRTLRWIRETPLAPADVVVLVFGVNEVTSQRRPSEFVQQYERLIDEVALQTGARHLIVSGVPPMERMTALPQPLRWFLGRWSAALDKAFSEAVARMPVPVTHVQMRSMAAADTLAADGFHPGPEHYRLWSQHLAEVIVPARD